MGVSLREKHWDQLLLVKHDLSPFGDVPPRAVDFVIHGSHPPTCVPRNFGQLRRRHTFKLDLRPRPDCVDYLDPFVRHRGAGPRRRASSRFPQAPAASFLASGHDLDDADRSDRFVTRRLARD